MIILLFKNFTDSAVIAVIKKFTETFVITQSEVGKIYLFLN